ncbi:hypothetical protein Tco_0205746 [Tanacetum coccineum]
MAAVNDVPQLVDKNRDGQFQPKTAEGDAKPESQWTADKRRVVVQNQRLKSIIMSCLPDDIMESVISYPTAKATLIDLVHSFEVPSDTKENRIMDLKLEYQTFRAKPNESLSQTYTRYKTLLNELANDGVNLSKHEINIGFVNSLPEKWLTFSQRPRNANHTRSLDLADIYGRFVYEDNLIQRRISKKILMIRKMKGLSLKPLIGDDEEVSDVEEVTQVKVLMALADDELTVGKSHARNGEWVDITIRKRHIREPIWYLDSGCSRSMTGVKSYLHKYVEHPGPKDGRISETVTGSETKQTTSLVPTEVKDTEQESKLNELTKLVHMLIDEMVNSNQKTQESTSKIQEIAFIKIRVDFIKNESRF